MQHVTRTISIVCKAQPEESLDHNHHMQITFLNSSELSSRKSFICSNYFLYNTCELPLFAKWNALVLSINLKNMVVPK